MKKILLFAIAAATMAVGCQKIQSLVNPDNTPVDENNPVEIKFSASNAVVETKAAVSTLAGIDLYVYGLNQDNPGKREIPGVQATYTSDTEYLALTDGPYFYNNNTDRYHFYGYHLGGIDATVGTDYTATVTIDGSNDILLAQAESDMNTDPTGDVYNAKNARLDNPVYPHLEFKHALAQFTFGAVNLGNTTMTLSGIKVNTPTAGTVTVAGTAQGVDATGTASDIAVTMTAAELAPGKEPEAGVNYPTVNATPVMVFPDSAYDFYFTLTQGTVTRTLKVTLDQTAQQVTAGHSYAINIKLYSLEEIKITASLKDWEYKSYTVETDSAEEVVEPEDDENGDDNGEPEPEA